MKGNRQRSSDEIILGCKEFGCPWNPYPATVRDLDFRRTGWFWWRKIRCENCGSLKIEKYNEGDVYFENRLSVKYDRPPGWYELPMYWSAARARRAELGYLGDVETEDSTKPDNVIKIGTQVG